jgi:hypothetical protein
MQIEYSGVNDSMSWQALPENHGFGHLQGHRQKNETAIRRFFWRFFWRLECLDFYV